MPKTSKLEDFFHNRSKKFYIISFLISMILVLSPLIFTFRFQEYRSLGLLGIFIANFVGSASVFLPAPTIVSVIIGGTMYNPLLVALVASVASGLGEAVGFLLGLSTQKVTGFKKHKILYNLLDFTFQKYGFGIVLVCSIIPNPIFDGVGILAGLTTFSIKKFLIAVFVGRLIRNIFLAYAANYF